VAKGPHAGSCYAVIITTLMFGGLGIPVERSLRWFSPKLQVAAEKLDEAGEKLTSGAEAQHIFNDLRRG